MFGSLSRLSGWKWLIVVGAMITVGAAVAAQAADDPEEATFVDNPWGIEVTRWVDPEGGTPISYDEWFQNSTVRGPFEIKQAASQAASLRVTLEGKVCVVANTDIYDAVKASIDRYIDDLSNDGFEVELYTTTGGLPVDLRTFLQSRYAAGMIGCVFIGNLPVAWYEKDCWDPLEHEQFPTDLYYMDMDGVFGDSDSDSRFDSHSGDVAPEIWMGRLTASPLTMDSSTEAGLLQNYFRKNHLYRTGRLPINSKALVYVDDDWNGSASSWNADVGNAYGDRDFFSDMEQTCADHYESYLPDGYDFVEVCVHSSPDFHSFHQPGDIWSYTSVAEVKEIDPVAHFFNLFACSNVRYVSPNYMGGWYVFAQSYGLACIGSTKTGSMLEFNDFYEPFGEGLTIGEAFRDWFSDQAAGGFADWEICWYYGMTLIGDPTLRKQPVVTASVALGPAPLTVDFTSDLGFAGTVTSWDFGDGEESAVQNPTHAYTQPGCHDVHVRMTNGPNAFELTIPHMVSAYADTMTVESIVAYPGEVVKVDVNLRNALDVHRIVIPYVFDGPLALVYDSFSTAGLRTEYFESQMQTNFDYFNNRAAVELVCSHTETSPPLEPGTGAVVSLWFTVPAGAVADSNAIEITSYNSIDAELETHAGTYVPEIYHGAIVFPATCCFGSSVGNVDASPDGQVTMADLTVLIDHLFISLAPVVCVDEANVDMSPDDGVTMADLTVLIDHLFISLNPLSPCP